MTTIKMLLLCVTLNLPCIKKDTNYPVIYSTVNYNFLKGDLK